MHNKHKLNNSPLYRQHRNLSPVDQKIKTKKAKEIPGKYPRASKEPTPPPKMQKHMASKSALETAEHLHYNSPTLPNTNTYSDRHTNPFTFTQLLQQNSQNISPLLSTTPIQLCQPSRSVIQLKQSKDKEKSMTRTPLTMTNMSHSELNMSQKHEFAEEGMEFTQLLKHKLNKLNSQSKSIDKSAPKSIAKSNPKSPLRVSNVHRLNNTPKLKDHKQKKLPEQRNKQGKTFTYAISQDLVASEKDDDVINLECSEKIFKFIRESQEKNKKNKSNLLSTGIINLSQPFQNSQSQANRLSKETLPSKVKIDRIISLQNVKQFESESPVHSIRNLPTIPSIKAKLQAFNLQINKHLQAYNKQNFLQELNGLFNPELKHSNTTEIVKQLQEISNQFRTTFQTLIKQISYASRKVEEDIQNYIESIKDSKKTMVDWISMDHYCEQKQKLELTLCKSEVFNLKIQQLSDNVSQHSSEHVQNSINLLQTQLTHQIQQLYSYLPNEPPERIMLTALPSNLRSKLESFQSILSSFQQLFSP